MDVNRFSNFSDYQMKAVGRYIVNGIFDWVSTIEFPKYAVSLQTGRQ